MKKTIKNFLPTAEAIQRLLHPYAEVVVHDIKQNKIAAIYHPFSKRRVGDDSLLSKEEMSVLEDCIGPYQRRNSDGKKLKSVSSLIRDENNNPVGMLCINLDVSHFEGFQQMLAEFMGVDNLTPQPEPLFKDDWQERINLCVHQYLSKHHLTLDTLNRSEKKELIVHLHKTGAFAAKNAAHYIAQVIKTSRATVYNYLAELTDS